MNAIVFRSCFRSILIKTCTQVLQCLFIFFCNSSDQKCRFLLSYQIFKNIFTSWFESTSIIITQLLTRINQRMLFLREQILHILSVRNMKYRETNKCFIEIISIHVDNTHSKRDKVALNSSIFYWALLLLLWKFVNQIEYFANVILIYWTYISFNANDSHVFILTRFTAECKYSRYST